MLCVCCEKLPAGDNSLCTACNDKLKEKKVMTHNDKNIILRSIITFEGVDYLAEAIWDICHDPDNHNKPYIVQTKELTLTERK